jgi:hypothetical protein
MATARDAVRFQVRRIRRLAEQPPAEPAGGPDRLERIGGQFLRHQPDQPPRRPVVPDDVVAVHGDLPALVLTMPQTMLISVVLPAPLGPSRAKITPRRMSRSTPLRAWKPEG